MMKTPRVTGAVLAGFAIITLSAVWAPAEERPGFETYVVRKGDTLSRIAGRIFGDAKRWREILKENPQVTNANRIFPGDSLLVPVPMTAQQGEGDDLAAGAGADLSAAEEVPVPTGEQEAAANVPAVPVVEVPELPVEQARAATVINPRLYRSAGYIASDLPVLAIVASQDERTLLGSGDAAIVNAPIPPGRRFTVVQADRRVFHPKTGEYLGWLTRVLGAAEVTCSGERTSTVMLSGLSDVAGVGDYLVPLDPNDTLEDNVLAGKIKPECVSAGACDGVVVAFNENRLSAVEQEIVYIDRGTSSGVAPGQRFTIYREIAPEGRITVGAVQILRAGERTATALITTSIQEVQLGDLLRAP